MTQAMIVVRDAEVAGRRADVLIDGAQIATIAERVAVPAGADVIEARGGALLPGLHDHHLHLLAMAAARRSVFAGPPEVRTSAELADALRRAARELEPGAWLRAVGYHQSVAGDLGRAELDRVVADRPVRVQHRSGAAWVLNSMAVDRLGIAALDRPGIERDGAGHPTGRLYGIDDWLRGRVAGRPPALAPVGEELARYGVTGVTDATPTERAEDAELLAAAVRAGDLPQRVWLTGGLSLPADAGALLPRGPVKLVVGDHDLPGLDDLATSIAAAHHLDRPVAVHAVTRAALLLALAAWDETGPRAGDRLEHGAVVPPGQAARLAALGITVVTQPAFVRDRGDDYLVEVDPDDVAHLWPCRSLTDAGVRVGGSSDAPFGHADPWRAMATAITRRTVGGRMLGPEERIDPEAALRLYLAPLDDPGGPPRTLRPGGDAELVLLGVPLAEALADPSADAVVATVCQGRLRQS